MEKRSISIIGTGVLGAILAEVLFNNDFPIAGLYNRHPDKARALRSKLNAAASSEFPTNSDELGTLIFLTVTDQHIEETAQRLSALCDNFTDCIVAHCSGVKTSAALQPLREKGAQTVSFHPLQTFTAQSNTDDFKNIYVDIEGDREAITYLRSVCEVMECHTLEIDPKAKKYLHASAVMASNYISALADNAAQMAELGGMDKKEALQALKPLLLQSAKNISNSDQLSEALSGPVSRGDIETVSTHLELLEDHKGLRSLYTALGQSLINLVSESELSEQDRQSLKKLFRNNNG